MQSRINTCCSAFRSCKCFAAHWLKLWNPALCCFLTTWPPSPLNCRAPCPALCSRSAASRPSCTVRLRCLEGCWLLNCCNTKRSLCKAAAGIAGGALQEQDPTPTPPRPAVASCQLRCQPLGNYGAACGLAHDFHTNQLLVGWLNRSPGSTNSIMECKVMQTMALIRILLLLLRKIARPPQPQGQGGTSHADVGQMPDSWQIVPEGFMGKACNKKS